MLSTVYGPKWPYCIYIYIYILHILDCLGQDMQDL